MSYLATEWFTCERCEETAAHEWHILGAQQGGAACPTVAVSVCQHCRQATVWMNGVKARVERERAPRAPAKAA